ncbi:MAG: hypothetical protein Q7T01_02465 [bacterium]|nr:hypothetical protein [bacterium]
MARDAKRHGKDRRDRNRYMHKQRGGHAPVPGGKARTATTREVPDARRDTREVTDEHRYNLRVPSALGGHVREIFVKVDRVRTFDQDGRKVRECDVTPKLVIVFRDRQHGVRGMPVPPAAAKRHRRTSFTHAVLQRIPEGARTELAGERTGAYDERGFRCTCFAPAGGQHARGGQHGEAVFDVVDELSVLQFLYEHDLTALYAVPHLASSGFLPMRDEDRMRDNSIAAQIQAAFGATARRNEPPSFHAYRLYERLLTHAAGGDRERTQQAMEGSARGRRFAEPNDPAMLAISEQFYASEGLGLAYAVYGYPDGGRFVASYDVHRRELLAIDPIPRDADGVEVLHGFQVAFLQNPNYKPVISAVFRAMIAGIRTRKVA